MICCNANKSKVNKKSKIKVARNFEKCLLHYVDDFSYDLNIESKLKLGYKLNKTLKVNDTVALIDKKRTIIKVKTISNNGCIDTNIFTKPAWMYE